MISLFQKVRDVFSDASYKRTLAVLGFLVVVAAIPLTVYVSQQQQEIRQQASGPGQCRDLSTTAALEPDPNRPRLSSDDFFWRVDPVCTTQSSCTTNPDCQPNNFDAYFRTPTDTRGNTNWCYGFESGFKCLKLIRRVCQTGAEPDCNVQVGAGTPPPQCVINNQTPDVGASCATCIINNAPDLRNNLLRDRTDFFACSNQQLVNFWCNGGVGAAGSTDCTTIKNNQCAAQCGGTGGASPTSPGGGAVSSAPTATLNGPTTGTTNTAVTYTAAITSATGVSSSNIWVAKEVNGTGTRVTAADVANFNANNFNCTDATSPGCIWYKIGSATTLSYTGAFTPLTEGTYKVIMDAVPVASNGNDFVCSSNPYVSYPLNVGNPRTHTFYNCGTDAIKTLVVSTGGGGSGSPTATPGGNGASPTSTTGGTTFNVVLNFSGVVGRTPITQNRPLQIELFDQAGTAISARIQGTPSVQYNATTGKYAGSFFVQPITPGNYNIKIKTDNHLRKRITGIVTVPDNTTQNTTVNLPEATLIVGDINDDNKLDILDWNMLLSCLPARTDSALCTPAIRSKANLNEDTEVEVQDWNIFIRNLAVHQAD